jgi:hypothetical protein
MGKERGSANGLISDIFGQTIPLRKQALNADSMLGHAGGVPQNYPGGSKL